MNVGSMVRGGAVALVIAAVALLWRTDASEEAGVETADTDMVVHTTPGCACCRAWIDTMRAVGFTVAVVEHSAAEAVARKNELGVPPALAACHTALVDGYVVEGHVPPEDVRRLLRERPAALGLAVPGMPPGSPGMTGKNDEGYRVLLVDSAGGTTVWRRVGPEGS